jgi:hypothetical protein
MIYDYLLWVTMLAIALLPAEKKPDLIGGSDTR